MLHIMHYISYITFFGSDNHSAQQFTHFIAIFILPFLMSTMRISGVYAGFLEILVRYKLIDIDYAFKTYCLIQGKKDPEGRNNF